MPSYRLPTFNLFCDIYTGGGVGFWPQPLPGGLPRVPGVACALVFGHRVNVPSTGGTGSAGVPILAMSLLLPPLTDLRGLQDGLTGPDVVECPVGSGRWYGCAWVDDIGKGYPNEHRTGCLLALEDVWAPPYP